MKIEVYVRASEENKATQGFATVLELPRGCGIDNATTAIENAVQDLRSLLIELFKSNTEGREPKLEHLEAK